MANLIAKENEHKDGINVFMWIGKSALVLVLTIIIASFYFDQFSLKQAIPYMGALLFIAGVSIAITKYHDSPNDRFKVAAFCCSVYLILLMAVNAAICFGVGRDMSVATDETDRSQASITACEDRINSMMDKAGPRAKLELSKRLADCRKGSEKVKTRQEIYGESGSLLYWVMLAEFFSAGGVLLLLIGLDAFKDRLGVAKNSIHQEDVAAEIAVRRELAAKQRQEMIGAIRAGQMTTGTGQVVQANPSQEPAINADDVRRGVVVDGWECVSDPSRNGHVWPTKNRWEYVGRSPSLPSTTTNQTTAQVRQNEARGHFRHDPPPQSPEPAETRPQSKETSNRVPTREGTRNGNEGTREGTQTPIGVLRAALKTLAREGHFFFNAEPKRNHILIRQMVSVKQKEESINSYTMDLEFLDFAQQVIDGERTMAEFVGVVREDLEAAGFDLEGGTR